MAPVYCASLLGLDEALHGLINTEGIESMTIPAPSLASMSKVSKQINAQGGYYSNALQAASYEGHERAAQLPCR